MKLPKTTRDCFEACTPAAHRHPGLWLDKFTVAGNQEDQGRQVQLLAAATGEGSLLRSLLTRRKVMLSQLGASSFTAATASPLAIHLARGGALENAGLALHPLYGFIQLPGSGLKGLARSAARQIWLPAQSDEAVANRKLLAVFGQSEGDEAAAGAVVFHDAWPNGRWPAIERDIVNNHHGDYYTSGQPAGDWESPTLVSFPVIGKGVEFSFAVSPRRGAKPPFEIAELTSLAAQWLQLGLTMLGAGAKTNAGYGRFTCTDLPAANLPQFPARETFTCRLELVTPAFLAGAEQSAADCDLRPATLRGLLRWWWRTMHAAHLDPKSLRELESLIWGSASQEGAVSVVVESAPGNRNARPVPGLRGDTDGSRKAVRRPDGAFAKQHGFNNSDDRKTSPGYAYLYYGMDIYSEDKTTKERVHRHRFILEPGTAWIVSFTVRPAFAKGNSSDAIAPVAMVKREVEAALSLLAYWGGLGSKSRRGFGTFTITEGMKVDIERDRLLAAAAEFREQVADILELQPNAPLEHPEVPCLEHAIILPDCNLDAENIWQAINRLGMAYQMFAKANKRRLLKEALGLPRRVGDNNDGHLRRAGYRVGNGEAWLGQKHPHYKPDAKGKEVSPENRRHASPLHLRVVRTPKGKFRARAIAFPSNALPDWQTSTEVLREAIKHLQESFGGPAPAVELVTGALVRCKITLPQGARPNQWTAKEGTSGMSGPIRNYSNIPRDAKSGDEVPLFITLGNGAVSFEWPTDELCKKYAPS